MTPNHYLLKRLSELLDSNKDYYLYHGCSLESAKKIISSGYIYSKAMLFGIFAKKDDALIKSLQKKLLIESDADNGFMDYVFLKPGKISDVVSPCREYGDIIFEVSPKILMEREFSVYNFNTGVSFKSNGIDKKFSGLIDLSSAFNIHKQRSEVLIRNNVSLRDYVTRVICSTKSLNELKLYSKRKDNMWSFKEAIFRDYSDESDEREIRVNYEYSNIQLSGSYDLGRYITEDGVTYLKLHDTSCILPVRISNQGMVIIDGTDIEIGNLENKKSIGK